MDVPRRARVTVSEYPPDKTAEFAPRYKQKRKVLMRGQRDPNFIPIITMGRYGKLLKKARPSDDAFIAMIESAQEIIRLSLQDLGPVKLPGTSHPLPGLEWPKKTISALAKVIWDKGVDVEIVLSNPGRYVLQYKALRLCSEACTTLGNKTASNLSMMMLLSHFFLSMLARSLTITLTTPFQYSW